MLAQFVPNEKRGHVNSGWLTSAHSFSFARYVNPERRNFGALLVVNEDTIAPGAGFGEHPHDNMEIVTIPLSGALRHEDSMGNKGVIRAGEFQAMSAGTGVLHSEVNASETEPVHLLQLWIWPNRQNPAPRYKQWNAAIPQNGFVTVAAPEPGNHFDIYQDAWISFGAWNTGSAFTVEKTEEGRGTFLLLVSGRGRLGGFAMKAGDGFEASGAPAFTFTAEEDCRVLKIDVPMDV